MAALVRIQATTVINFQADHFYQCCDVLRATSFEAAVDAGNRHFPMALSCLTVRLRPRVNIQYLQHAEYGRSMGRRAVLIERSLELGRRPSHFKHFAFTLLCLAIILVL
ncbi:uncharacterized protein ARMOST_13511 [Armillaria ostoyae]|uniref:Uncharacterized protein n=1 Tax=Armillaria ostoyae TaxID=47428 RepID=A0A284RN02_ARMOS|nr:uncharacterized protein ARMOST_13511 [Armillaria ostoyae]